MGQPIKKTDLKTPWAKRALSTAKEAKFAEFKKILVVTQDSASSRFYFTEWKSRLHGASTYVDVIPSVKAPLQLVSALRSQRKEVEGRIARAKNLSKFVFDEVWVAFDRDSFDDFDNAVYMLRAMSDEGYREAWSNECFELWYLLHWCRPSEDVPIPRKDLFGRCSTHFKTDDYCAKKGDADVHRLMANCSIDEVKNAIDNANLLEGLVAQKYGPNAQPSCLNPMTKVSHLIQKFVQAQLEGGA